MKPWLLQQPRRANSFRQGGSAALLDSSGPAEGGGGGGGTRSAFWLLLHGLCCLVSLVLGFRFSRLVFFLLFSTTTIYTSAPILHTTTTTTITTTRTTETLTLAALPSPLNLTKSRVVVGRHGIRIRPWPHPNPTEVMRAHHIIERVQREQHLQYGVRSPRPILVVTPTYVRTFQALHLTGLAHSLMNLPYDLTWIVVEAGGVSNETAALLARSRLPLLHIPFREQMPTEWAERHRMEARMRLHALRVIRERRLDGIVVFADDSNMHSMELFDEIQEVKWMAALSVGILTQSGDSDRLSQRQKQTAEEKENSLLPIQGPACNSSSQLVGWHTFNSLPYMNRSATNVGEGATVLPTKLEWAGFVLNSRLLWKEADGKPDWVRDLDAVGENGEEIESPLTLLKDASFVEPLGNCGKKVLLWWLRVEARSDSKFPRGWIIDPPLEIIVPAKRTPWPHAPLDPEIVVEKTITDQDRVEKHSSRTGRTSRSRRSSRKRKHDSHAAAQFSAVSGKQET